MFIVPAVWCRSSNYLFDRRWFLERDLNTRPTALEVGTLTITPPMWSERLLDYEVAMQQAKFNKLSCVVKE